jgi:GTPase SAR1 family protein
MKTELEHRLQQFVNREDEIHQFCDMLDTGEKPVMVVWGDSGIGKSSLLARMIHECALRKLYKSEIVWTPTRNHNYMYIMRKIRDDVGVEYFSRFTDLINYFTSSNYELKIKVESNGPIEVTKGAQFKNSKVGDIAGIIIKDFNITGPRDDQAVPEEERMRRLTDQFVDDLAEAIKDKTLIVFFDAIEKMTSETEAWVSNELLGAVRDGRLSNIRFVLCGEKKPVDIEEWSWMVEEAELRPLEREYIIEYLAKQGVDESSHEVLADMLLVATKGYADRIANFVEAFLKMQRKPTND